MNNYQPETGSASSGLLAHEAKTWRLTGLCLVLLLGGALLFRWSRIDTNEAISWAAGITSAASSFTFVAAMWKLVDAWSITNAWRATGQPPRLSQVFTNRVLYSDLRISSFNAACFSISIAASVLLAQI